MRDKKKRENPLKVEELCNMTCAAVWLVNLCGARTSGYVFILNIDDDGVLFRNAYNEKWYRLSEYGQTWLAYADRAEEVQHETN